MRRARFAPRIQKIVRHKNRNESLRHGETKFSEDTSVEEIARLMTTHAIKRLPVMTDGAIVGIVSRADIVSAIAQGEHVAIHSPIYDL